MEKVLKYTWEWVSYILEFINKSSNDKDITNKRKYIDDYNIMNNSEIIYW